MDELMRQKWPADQKNEKQEVTCCVSFTNPKFNREKPSSGDELNSVTRLVSKTEDLELDRVFNGFSKDGSYSNKSLNRSLFEFGHNFEDVEGWLKMDQPPKDQLASVLRYMFEAHLKTTVQIDINKMYFNCHFIVLQVYSRFFSELKQIPLLVTLPKDLVSQRSFMLIYKWMLSDNPVLDRRYIVEVFVAATYLRIDDLQAHCWKYFDDSQCYDEDTACVLYVETKYHPALDLVRNVMLTRINKFLLTFVASKDFLDLPLNHLIFLLSSDKICVNTEIEILFIVVRWLGHDWSKRSAHAQRLASCIRFSLMPLWYLLYVRCEEHQLVQKLISFPEVDDQINESISRITSRMYEEKIAALDGEDFLGDLEPQPQRTWICDRLCQYYHWVGCPNTRDIRFQNFEDYLSELHQSSLDHWSKVKMVDPNKKTNCCSPNKSLIEDLSTEANNNAI
ncbi:kelch repeat and BTB domain-containing protein 8 [Drosophila takahashii]|uniref:kelch repeat and BTB domain-containing protein 8 n=1 Tax=Drosophila takahashii TaxID=29030 RepID=UPI0038996D90